MGSKAHRKNRRIDKQRIEMGIYDPFESHNKTPTKKNNIGPVSAKTNAQGQLLTQIYSKDIIFATGPAGTGKTYVSAAAASDELKDGMIEKIIVSRPMQSCDEDMGFLPGTAKEKYEPWVAPVVDVLNQRLGKSHVEYLVKTNKIEYIPLMMMRGASFKNAWILLDEAQNTSPDQMKMFLTRIGENCKMIISGDKQQSDRRDGRGVVLANGLDDAVWRLKNLSSVAHVEFTTSDIVRHGIIKDILACY